jgi:hypothetical protein
MSMTLEDFEVHSTKYLDEVKQIHGIFRKKRQLEHDIVHLIKQFEAETGVAIDIVKYERDITIPLNHKSYYTDLKIIVMADEDNNDINAET